MYSCEVVQLESSHNNVRTKEIKGEAVNLPVVGERWPRLGEALNPAVIYRYFRTSVVKDIIFTERDDTIIIHTENSKYKIKYREVEGVR
jgi:hypothetical protein